MTKKQQKSKRKAKDQKSESNWTVTIYMAANNNLAEESVWALTEIRDTTLNNGVKVNVLFDSNAEGVNTKLYSFPGNGTKQNLLTTGDSFSILVPRHEDNQLPGTIKDFLNKQLQSEIVNESEKKGLDDFLKVRRRVRNASDRRLLEDFLKKTLAQHTGGRQLLVLSGHGSGAIGDFLSGNSLPGPKGVISITGLGNTLENVRKELNENGTYPNLKFDIIGMDSCLMSMAEVGYELRKSADILIGSEGFEPETGWPYARILPEVKGGVDVVDGVDPETLARKIVGEYISYYATYNLSGTSIDLSALNLKRSDDLAEGLRNLSNNLIIAFKGTEKEKPNQKVIDAVLLAHWRAQSYKNEQYVDLKDFCDLLEKGCRDSEGMEVVKAVSEACGKVIKVIDGEGANSGFVICSKYFGSAFQHSHGVSIYFPWKDSQALDKYRNLSFAKRTKWYEFLKIYVEKTQRERRGESKYADYLAGLTEDKIEPINIIPAERPLVIPLLVDALAGTRNPPDSGRNPPDSGRGMLGGGDVMKNSPTSFLIEKDTGKAIE